MTISSFSFKLLPIMWFDISTIYSWYIYHRFINQLIYHKAHTHSENRQQSYYTRRPRGQGSESKFRVTTGDVGGFAALQLDASDGLWLLRQVRRVFFHGRIKWQPFFTILVYHNYNKLFLSQCAKIDVESFGIVSTQYLDNPSAEWEIAHPFMG